MSIFGSLDTTKVPDDPFYIKPGTYWSFCTDAVVKETKDGGTQLVLTWTIDEPDSDYHHKTKQEWFSLFPEHEGEWDKYSAQEKEATSWLKRRLRRAFDLSESEIDAVECSELQGKGAFLTLRESEGKEGTANAGKKFINIFDALSKRLYEEENGTKDSVSSSLGLGSSL